MIQFLVHEKDDNVGVATVDIKTGEVAQGLFMDSQESVEMKSLHDIPLGHKIALTDLAVDQFGESGGLGVAPVIVGHHSLNGDAVVGVERDGTLEEGGAGVAFLVVVDLGVRESAVVVDHRVDVVEPDAFLAVPGF